MTKPIKPVFGKQKQTAKTTLKKTKSAPKIRKEPKKPTKKTAKKPLIVTPPRQKGPLTDEQFDGYEDDIEDLEIFKVHGFSMKDLGVNNSTIDAIETEEIQGELDEDGNFIDFPDDPEEENKIIKEPPKPPIAEPKKPDFAKPGKKTTKPKRSKRKAPEPDADADVKQEYDPDAPPSTKQKVRKRQSKPRTKRPDTYKERIKMAIRNCGGSSAVHMIYKFMEEKWPEDYVADKRQQWQNSIRHNLSLHKKDFRRIHKNGRQEWAVVEEEGRLSAVPTEEDESTARRSRKKKNQQKQIESLKPQKTDLRIPLNKQLLEAHKKGSREVVLVSQRDAIILCTFYQYFFYELGNTAAWMQRLTFQAIEEDERPRRLCPGVVPIPTSELIANTLAHAKTNEIEEEKKKQELQKQINEEASSPEPEVSSNSDSIESTSPKPVLIEPMKIVQEQSNSTEPTKLVSSNLTPAKLLASRFKDAFNKTVKDGKTITPAKPSVPKQPENTKQSEDKPAPKKPVFGRARRPVFKSPFIKKE